MRAHLAARAHDDLGEHDEPAAALQRAAQLDLLAAEQPLVEAADGEEVAALREHEAAARH